MLSYKEHPLYLALTDSGYIHTLEYVENMYRGIVTRLRFQNDYGASIISHEFSYGGQKGLYELMPLSYIKDVHTFGIPGHPLFNDARPIGYLELDEVVHLCKEIMEYNMIQDKLSPKEFYDIIIGGSNSEV